MSQCNLDDPEEPHTSGTALCMCMCMFACLQSYTVNFKWAYLNISWRQNVLGGSCHAQPAVGKGLSAREQCRCERSLEQRWLKLMHAWQLWTMTDIATFPGLPRFCSSVCIQYNTWKRRNGEKQERPGSIHHVNDVRWTWRWTRRWMWLWCRGERPNCKCVYAHTLVSKCQWC